MEKLIVNNCNCCYKTFSHADIFCNSCGYPLQGTEQEQKTFIAIRNNQEIDLAELDRQVKSARNSLYWIGGVIGLWTLIGFFTSENADDAFSLLIINIILVGGFCALGVWSKTKPAAALISGLSLYIIIQVLNAIVSPMTIFSGIIFKIIIIGYLIKGIKAVLESEKIKKDLNIL
ncbi:hypothetical protein [Pedobacter sp. N23S346]|uniref:hypothetical protein n=1 Tax=Pedobacter sp. N23S346 TaxID=3402750 RepID=UPI003AC0B98B